MSKVMFYHCEDDVLITMRQDDDGIWSYWMVDHVNFGFPIVCGKSKPRMDYGSHYVMTKDWQQAVSALRPIFLRWKADRISDYNLADDKDRPGKMTYGKVNDDTIITMYTRVFSDGEWRQKIGFLGPDTMSRHTLTSSSGDEIKAIPDEYLCSYEEALSIGVKCIDDLFNRKLKIFDDWVHFRDVDEEDLYPILKLIRKAKEAKAE